MKKTDGITNVENASLLEKDFKNWKTSSLEKGGYFPVFLALKEEFLLRELSGGAVKLYLYLGLHSGNMTGRTWVSIETMARYFNKSPRTISNWLLELEKFKLIERMQMEMNGVSNTFLRPY